MCGLGWDYFARGCLIDPTSYVEKTILYWIAFAPLSKIKWPYLCKSISGLFLVCSINLCVYHSVYTTAHYHFFFFFGRAVHGILVPQPGIEPVPSAVKVQSPLDCQGIPHYNFLKTHNNAVLQNSECCQKVPVL